MLAKRKRVSRSPNQSRKPGDARTARANAAVRTALIFWPALKRPCGAGLRPLSQRRSSRSKTSISRAVAREAAAVAERATISDERDRPRRRPIQMWMLWTSGRRPIRTSRAPGGRGSARSRAGRRTPPRSPSAAPARCGRSAAGQPGFTSRTRSSGRPRRRCRSRAAPSSRCRRRDEVDPVDPLDVLVAVHVRDHDPHRRAVLPRQRLAVHLVGEHHVGQPRLLERRGSRRRAARPRRTGARAPGCGARAGEQVVRGGRRPSARSSRSSR